MMIVLNNKCNFTKEEFSIYISKLKSLSIEDEVILCPSNIYLNECSKENLKVGSQNVSQFGMGAYTGEISALQLKNLDIKYCIVGHSERRKYFNETDDIIKEKIINLLEHEIIPIFCIGEDIETKKAQKTEEFILNQLAIIDDIPNKESVVIAYEPIWAIGSGVSADSKTIDKVLEKVALKCNNTILYGGSVNEENIEDLRTSEYIDGYLIGSLSLYPEKIKEFLKKC